MTTTSTAAPSRASAGTYTIDRTHSEVLFRVRHLLTRVGGRFHQFEGTITVDPAHPERSRVEVSIDAASIDTSVADRDAHLKSEDFFYVEKYPALTFTSDRVTATAPDTFLATGTLTMRGVAKTIELPVTALGTMRDPWGNEKAGFEASVQLNRKDFGLMWNAALETGGFLVGDEVSVTLSIQAVRDAKQ